MRSLGLLCFILLQSVTQGKNELNVLNDLNFNQERMVGSTEVKPNSLPFMAALSIKVYGQEEPTFCGGSLINTVFILTAGHCTETAIVADIILGAHNITAIEYTQQKFRSKVFITHKEWSWSTLENDIGLVRLPRPAFLNDAVKPILLPKLSDQDNSFTHNSAILAGWGKTANSDTTTSPVLRYIKSTIVRPLLCKVQMLGKVGSKQICLSGSGKKSGCEGDSGSPLVMLNKNGEPVIQGIFSFILNFGCERGLPQACTKVSKYLWWIFEHTGISVQQ